jgi:hypothetical protein
MKILEFKRSRIRSIVEFRGIPNGFLNKDRNVEQQKALIFESDNCKYDVILGADFSTEIGIDVKYSIGSIE